MYKIRIICPYFFSLLGISFYAGDHFCPHLTGMLHSLVQHFLASQKRGKNKIHWKFFGSGKQAKDEKTSAVYRLPAKRKWL